MKNNKLLGLILITAWLLPWVASAQDNAFVQCKWLKNEGNQDKETFCSLNFGEYKADGCPNSGVVAGDQVCCCQKPAAYDTSCHWSVFRTETPMSGQTYYSGGCVSGEKESPGERNCGPSTKPETSLALGTTAVCCCADKSAAPSDIKAPTFTIPTFQVPIPTVKLSQVHCDVDSDGRYQCSIPWLGEYINGIYQYGLSVAGILAAIMLMAGGVMWLISGGDASRVTLARELIVGSVTGIIILLCSYIILNQINPGLLNFRPLKIGTVSPVTIVNKYELQGCSGPWQTSEIVAPALSPEVTSGIKKIAAETKIDPCYFYAIVTQESAGKPGAFGDDRQVANCGVASRRKYICSLHTDCCGKECQDATCKSYTENPKIGPKKDIDNLDFNYTYGFGLGQVTYSGNPNTLCNDKKGFKYFDECYNFADLLKIETNLRAVAHGTKKYYCPTASQGTVSQGCFEKYAGSGSWATCTGGKKMKVYESCKQTGFDNLSGRALTISN